jgi:hypothetical protein
MYFAQSNTMKPMFCLNRQFTRFCPQFLKPNQKFLCTDKGVLYIHLPINQEKSYLLERYYYENACPRAFFNVFLLPGNDLTFQWLSRASLMDDGDGKGFQITN